MSVSSPRALLISFFGSIVLSLVLGSLYAWLGDKVWWHAFGTVLFILGLIILVIGLLGAVEPKEGWASKRKQQERRSMAAQVTRQHPDLQEATGIQLGVWGALVGLPLIALALLAFSFAAS